MNIDPLLAKLAEARAHCRRSNGADKSSQARADARTVVSSNTGTVAPIASPPVGENRTTPELPADVVILCALEFPERHWVQRVFGSHKQWDREIAFGTLYSKAELGGDKGQPSLSVVTASQNAMGLVSAAILATNAIHRWRPRLLVMTGICAGVRGKTSIGDVIVAQDVFDYGSGKIVGAKLLPDYRPVEMAAGMQSIIRNFASQRASWEPAFSEWPTQSGYPRTNPKIHVGAMASGAAVVSDDKTVQGIVDHKRSLVGLDMEAYAVARAVQDSGEDRTRALIVKCVCDHADDEKSDEFQEYCAFASAVFARTLIQNLWPELSK